MSKNNQNNEKPQYYEDYAADYDDAVTRYCKNGKVDCYPQIAPALLNSADIKAYVKQTGMIYPFHEGDLQSASYKVKIAGKVIYWKYNDYRSKINETPETDNYIDKVELDLKRGDGFDLQPNSIAFVTLEPEFLIPRYIALRFNLKIKHIYKGLLLGTGPLVDPGFRGRLSIPLHNLTNNVYHFNYGETLITMEFTKLSPNAKWQKDFGNPGHDETFEYEDISPNRSINDYISQALDSDKLKTVISSIPKAIYNSEKQAEEAKEQAVKAGEQAEESKKQAVKAGEQAEESKKQAVKAEEKVEKVRSYSNAITIGGLIGVFTIVVTCITLTMNAFNNANARYDKIKEEIQGQYSSEIEALNNKINELNERIKELENQETTNV